MTWKRGSYMPLSGGKRKVSYRKAQALLLLVAGGLDQLTQTPSGSSQWNDKKDGLSYKLS